MSTWLRSVIQSVRPWYSPEDILTGSRWNSEIANALDEMDYGILFLNADNKDAPWMLFEAGALGKSVKKGRVSPYLIGVDPVDITGPLQAFNMVRANKEGTIKLLRDINSSMEDKIDESILINSFDKWWPELETAISEAEKITVSDAPDRSVNDMLSELIVEVRSLARANRGEIINEGINPIIAYEIQEFWINSAGIEAGRRIADMGYKGVAVVTYLRSNGYIYNVVTENSNFNGMLTVNYILRKYNDDGQDGIVSGLVNRILNGLRGAMLMKGARADFGGESNSEV